MTSNVQLENFAKNHKFKNFRGVIFRNEFNTLHPLRQECGIYGSKDNTQDNMHWCAWYKDGDYAYCFDSFGLEPTKEIIKYLRKSIKVGNIKYSTFQIQKFSEDLCGEYCLYFLDEMNKKKKFVDVILNLVKDNTY